MSVMIERDPDRADRIAIAAPYHFNDLIKTIPGSSWSREHERWSVPLAWTACVACRSVFGPDMEIGPLLAAWAVAEKEHRIIPAMALRDAMDAPGDPDLYGHQRSGVQFLTTVERGLLTDEPGCGKTATAIRALKTLYDRGEDVFPALIVAPNTVKRTWAREFAHWWPDPSVVVVDGTAAQRRKQIESDSSVVVVNWEALRTHSRLAPYGSTALKRCAACGGSGAVRESACQVHDRELNAIDFNTVIADEAHRGKNAKSLQTLALRGATGSARFRWALTGTPIANDPTELWSILNWLDPQEWPSRTKWVERLVAYTYNVWGGMEVGGIRPDAEAEFRATVDPRMRRMTKEAVLPFLPPRVFERRDVPMHPKQEKAYRQMAEEMVARLDSGILLSSNPMVQTGRLTQFASAYGDIENAGGPQERLVLGEPSNKVAAFLDDLDDFGDQSIAVFAESRQLIELLSAALLKKGVRHGLVTGAQNGDERQHAIESFQSGDTRLILCTIKAGGVGITLTRASVAVFLQRSWSNVDMEQAYNRCHRIGSEQHASVTFIDYVTPGTVEEGQIWALNRKGDLMQQIVRDADLLRKILNGGTGE